MNLNVELTRLSVMEKGISQMSKFYKTIDHKLFSEKKIKQ